MWPCPHPAGTPGLLLAESGHHGLLCKGTETHVGQVTLGHSAWHGGTAIFGRSIQVGPWVAKCSPPPPPPGVWCCLLEGVACALVPWIPHDSLLKMNTGNAVHAVRSFGCRQIPEP